MQQNIYIFFCPMFTHMLISELYFRGCSWKEIRISWQLLWLSHYFIQFLTCSPSRMVKNCLIIILLHQLILYYLVKRMYFANLSCWFLLQISNFGTKISLWKDFPQSLSLSALYLNWLSSCIYLIMILRGWYLQVLALVAALSSGK